MLCLTAQHSSATTLARELELGIAKAQQIAIPFLVEFRFDSVREIDDALFQLAKKHAANSIFCMRSKQCGGFFEGELQTQLQILQKLVLLRPRYLDIAPDLFYSETNLKNKLNMSAESKLIVSTHATNGNWQEFENEVARIAASSADIVKGAITMSDTSETLRLLELSRSIHKEHVLMGMGVAGRLSRLRYRNLKAPWTYVATSEKFATAPGQLTLEEALHYGLPQSASYPFVAIIGGETVQHSPGPLVYNSIFRKKNLPWSYIAAPTNQPDDTLRALKELGARGCSVTTPHKKWAAELRNENEMITSVDSANSIKWENGSLKTHNTDIMGFEVPLRNSFPTKGNCCLILGAGGASSAAVRACQNLELSPIVCARDLAKARQKFPLIPVVEWKERAIVQAEILINTTTLGGQNDSAWPHNAPLKKSIVFDCALAKEPSQLLARARDEGAITISPYDMWVSQGKYQMEWILGLQLTEEELRQQLPA